MAETSGFFDSVLDESTGEYDIEYLSSQFAAYFANFVGNGVFGSPTNQLRVHQGNGLEVIVSEGWAFIEGYWYHNDTEKVLVVPPNSAPRIRTDAVMCRLDKANRRIGLMYSVSDVDPMRDSSVFDLKLAEIILPIAATEVLEENITDTRMNESVCGFVTSLLEVQTTEDLFAQYQAQFNSWFEGVKGKLSEDAAGALQLEIYDLKNDLLKVYANAGIRIGGFTDYLKSDIIVVNPVIKTDSIINVYFNEDSKEDVSAAGVHYVQENGSLHIMFDTPQPEKVVTVDEIVVSNQEYTPSSDSNGGSFYTLKKQDSLSVNYGIGSITIEKEK